MTEEDLRALCARLLAGGAEEQDEQLLVDEPEVARQVGERLEAVGCRLVRRADQAPLVVIEDSEAELGELPLACLALLAVALPEGNRKKARVTVNELWRRVGEPAGYTEAYLRRAGLGPLEARGLVRVVKPAQRASEAYIVAGPALAAIDSAAVEQRLRAVA